LSISFDRAAGYYDRTRAFPDEVMARLVPMLAARLGPGRCLEIGVGTGRIALPLTREGIDVVGVDIAPAMLQRLLENAGGPALPVAVADATRLPFAGGTFSSGVAAHVLHLIPEWQAAVDELLRVVVPGGTLVASRGNASRSEWQRALRRHFFEEAGDPPWPPGADRIEEVDEAMRARGAEMSELEEIRSEAEVTPREHIEALERGTWSACWVLEEAALRRSAEATRRWAEREIGDLDEPRAAWYASVWRAYRLPE
jgi:SAM-dependent methyltransferase